MPQQLFTLSDGSPLTRQENFVLRQVAKGEIADLKQEFGEAEADRRLRARFLEELLTGIMQGVKIHRRGVRVVNAVIDEPLDLENAKVVISVELNDCIFQESVNFRDALLKYLDIRDSHFFKAADFHRIKVERGFFCRKAMFNSSVNLGSASIGGQFAADKAKFLSETDEANFNSIRVGQHAFFDEAEFHGPVNYGSAEIKGQFTAEAAKFLSEKYAANFNAIHADKYVSFERAEFQGAVDFVSCHIGQQFRLDGAKFISKNHKVNFNGMYVAQDAFFQGCDFHGLVSFVLIKVAGDLHLEPLLKIGQEMSATFRSDVNFRGADIGGELLADKAQFLGHIVNLEAVRVGRSFHASGALFAGSVNFTEMAVKNNFYIDPFGRLKSSKTLFKGPANFTRITVGGVFNAEYAIFQGEEVIFTGIEVGQAALFNGTIFFGGLVLKEGQLTDLVIRGLHRLSVGGLPLEEIVLNRTRIEHRLTIENVEVKRFHARHLEVKGPAELRRLAIKGEADLRDAALHHFQIIDPEWPAPRDGKKKVYLDGLAYQSITTKIDPDKAEKWPELLAWLGLSRFNTQNFQELDAFFQRGGLRKWADKVYIAGKRRELGKVKWGIRPGG